MSVIINGTSGISTDGGSELFGSGSIGGSLTLTSGTANGVTYLNGSKVLTSGSALTFDGTTLTSGTVDINGGAIDGTTIGASSAAAITGTTITGTSFVSSGDMTFADNDKASLWCWL
jgi:formylmethanofuran dehydrogenase subunit C